MKTFGILGDSYSTFKGYIPEENHFYYPRPEAVEDVLRVEQTWWHRLKEKRGLRLLFNESYSGATVCENIRPDLPEESAFTKRAIQAFGPGKEEKPDIIFLFGCTNDDWLNRDLGQLQYENWSTVDLQQILPAYCYIIHNLKLHNPNAAVVAIINTELKEEIREGMIRAGEHYGALNVVLCGIDKQNGHPTALGMEQISRQVDAVLDNL